MSLPQSSMQVYGGPPPYTHQIPAPLPYSVMSYSSLLNSIQGANDCTASTRNTLFFWLRIPLVIAIPLIAVGLRITFDAFGMRSLFFLLPYVIGFHAATFAATSNRPSRFGNRIITPATAIAFFSHLMFLILLSLSLPDQHFIPSRIPSPFENLGLSSGSSDVLATASIIGVGISAVACLAFAIMEKPSAKYMSIAPNSPHR